MKFKNPFPKTAMSSDILNAYDLSASGLSPSEISTILENLQLHRKTYSYLEEAVKSNRYPYTVMLVAAKIGMYIPPRKRLGIAAYKFFISNIRYYEATFERADQEVPGLYTIYMAKDKVNMLMKFRDDEILKAGYQFSRNYSSRLDMINKFIAENISVYGYFSLDSNSRKSYGSKAKVITYQEAGQKWSYSANEFLLLMDMSRGTVWKNSSGFLSNSSAVAFSRFSLHHLRQQILEKFEQWRHRDGLIQTTGPTELYNILVNLENLLANDVRNDASAYLGNPVLTK